MSKRDKINTFEVLTILPDVEVNENDDVAHASIKLVDRPLWNNKFQFLLSAIGYAVGLGNVWRFPYLCQKNGGGAFLIPYFIMLIIEGIPLFYLEISIGQRLRKGSVGVWNHISPYMGGVGFTSMIIAYLVSMYYIIILTWCLFYLYNSFQSPLPWSTCPQIQIYDSVTNTSQLVPVPECERSSPTQYFLHRVALQQASSIEESGINWQLVVCLIVAWVLIYVCLLRGITISGKVVYFTATFPYFVLVIFFIRGMLLEGHEVGIKYLITPKLDRLLDPLVWLDAASQIFFSLGLGFGTLIALASYNSLHENTLRDALTISITNSFTSLFAAVVVFSVLGFRATFMMKKCEQAVALGVSSAMNPAFNASVYSSMAHDGLFNASFNVLSNASFHGLNWTEQMINPLTNSTSTNLTSSVPICDVEQFLGDATGGTGLAFIAFSEAVNEMPGSPFWSVLFFFMLLTLGMDSMFGGLESVITSLEDTSLGKNIRREILTGILCIIGLLVGLSMVQFSGEYVLQLLDSFCSTVPMLFICFMELIGIVWIYGLDRFCDDIVFMTGRRPGIYWRVCWKILAPISLLIILLFSIYTLVKGRASYMAWDREKAEGVQLQFPDWSVGVASTLVFMSIMLIPGVALIKYRGLRQSKLARASSLQFMQKSPELLEKKKRMVFDEKIAI